MIDEATWGGDDDVGDGHHFILTAIAYSSVEEGDFEAGVFAVFFELFGDLVSEFAGGFEDEYLGFAFFGDAGERREGEGGGFSGSGL